MRSAMTIASREAAILRVRAQGIHPELSKSLRERLRTAVVGTVKTVMEEALKAEMGEFLSKLEGKKSR